MDRGSVLVCLKIMMMLLCDSVVYLRCIGALASFVSEVKLFLKHRINRLRISQIECVKVRYRCEREKFSL
jgi:hypothetical protein